MAVLSAKLLFTYTTSEPCGWWQSWLTKAVSVNEHLQC